MKNRLLIYILLVYARGDYGNNSDVDIMVLVNLSDKEIESYLDAISDLTFDFFLKYGVDISLVVKNEEHFYYWVETRKNAKVCLENESRNN